MGFYQRLDDRQAQPTFVSLRAGFIDPVKAVENKWQVFLGNAGAGIFYGQLDVPVGRLRCQVDFSTGGGVAQGIS